MYELLDLLGRLPRPLKYLGTILLLIPVVYVISRWLGVEKYWWVFVLGMLVIALALALFNMALRAREKRQASAFEGELRRDSQKAGASKEEVRQALGDLAAKWSESVNQLKQSGLSVYSLPWYLLIGEPQSGKSTTLKNSGLEFPVGTEGLSGAGGTRNCDWWFANEAVILDTAGRFTFQEEAAPDQQEWSSFLKLLRRYRKYCPVNGVIVVIPCTSLLEDPPEEQERKAANIRAKLLHVQRVLQIRFPVFIMVTKADRILGFAEFFLKLDPVDQQQLFGWSSPEGPGKAWDPESFDGVYDAIVERLYKLRLKLLGDEENPAQADKLYVFPEEFRAMRTPLKGYLKTIFQQTRFDEPFAFRGFYVSSGVQQGRPIAQATRDLLEAPGGAAEGAIESLESIFKKSRAFFIRHFYEKKVFPEQGLITRTAAAEVQQRRTLWLVRGLGVLVLLLFLGGMIPAYNSLQKVLNPIRRDVKTAQECALKGCTVSRSWEVARGLQEDRDRVLARRWVFALFLRGTRSNELTDTLARIQQKVYLGGVVAPLLAETEGRMAALDWETFGDYQSFRAALSAELDWVAFKKPPETPIVRAEELRALPLVDFVRKTKGMKGSEKSAEIDEWVSKLPAADPAPDHVLEGSRLHSPLAIAVPDPAGALAKYEEFWSVGNLARWDAKLQDGLARYVALYQQMTSVPKTAPPAYLGQVADPGKKFKENFERLTRHMGTPRPGEKGFPGATLDQWKKYLNEDYAALIKWNPIAPGWISESRHNALLARLDTDHQTLRTRESELAYLIEKDPTGKVKWSKPAESLGGVLNDLAGFTDLTAYAASEDGRLLETLRAEPSWTEKPKKIDAWRMRQDSLAKAILTKSSDLSTASPDPRFQWADRRPIVDQTTQLALVWRTLSVAQPFFEESLVTQCPAGNCFQPAFARAMIPSASAIVSAASAQLVALRSFEGAAPAVTALADTEATYLRRYIDQMSGHAGGGGFAFPDAAAGAGTWPAFQRAISSWQPSGGGASAAPDASGQLTSADLEQFAAANQYLAPVLEEYRRRIERPRLAAAAEKAAPELIAAAESFRGAVTGVSDQPLKAWRQLSTGEGGQSLKQYKAFSDNPRLRSDPTALRLKRSVEDHGAHLLRDAIRPQFAPRAAEAYGRISGCCLGKFPLINEMQLQTERAQLASGQGYSRGGPAGAAVYRIEVPTIGLSDLSGPLSEFGAIASEFAIDPILRGEANEFDFVGAERPVLAVARAWQLFIYGVNAPPGATAKPHAIEVRSIERTPSAGTIFLGDRVGQVTLFDRATILRPSTDVKSGRTPPPYVWRLSSADSPLEIIGRNEDVKGGWTGSLVIGGGPLKLFGYVLRASEDRRPGADPRVWDIRVEIPDAERPSSRLQGVFELKLDDPLPGVIPR
ncbi:MAG TPA: type VI secretion protein IcmF/TssM N-terminal domain-containing protein [Thermoanaerobaculia bacterium]|nr:type VI secretion protein IcmF/TssM N-terminal domain-containing protein [Thermoanaerobaculia bacterium]